MGSDTEDESRLLQWPWLFLLDEKRADRKTQDAKAEREQGLFECGYEDVCWLEALRREAALVAV
jgi:hypothetical protein